MRAIVMTKSGSPDGLQLQEVDKPTPQAGEVLVRVHAATVTAGDGILRKLPAPLALGLRLFGVRRKKIPGHEFAGVVEAVGAGVTRFKPGDAVFGTTSGLSVGANADYVCVPEAGSSNAIALMPSNMGYEEAAAVPVGGMAALYILKPANIQPGQTVLIYGASGSVGTYAVQLARHFGAEVTGVCSSANVELVKSLGADHVIDYTQQNFASSGAAYDVIFDAVRKIDEADAKAVLKPGGVVLSIKSSTRELSENLMFLKELVEAGRLKSVIDRRYPLEQTAEAHRYVDTGRKRGNVVITVAP